MDDTWFTECADELARCLVDARNCAEACEAHLNRRRLDGPAELRRAVDVLAAAAADELGGPADVVAALRTVSESAAELLETAG